MNWIPPDAWCRAAAARSTVRTAVKTALVVGPTLTLINQWEAIFGPTPLDWVKVALTFLVPYLVATHAGAASLCSQQADS